MCIGCGIVDGIDTVITKITNIKTGIINNIVPTVESEALYNKRYPICMDCKDKYWIVKINDNPHWMCKKCNCLLTLKTKVPKEKCSLNKW